MAERLNIFEEVYLCAIFLLIRGLSYAGIRVLSLVHTGLGDFIEGFAICCVAAVDNMEGVLQCSYFLLRLADFGV